MIYFLCTENSEDLEKIIKHVEYEKASNLAKEKSTCLI